MSAKIDQKINEERLLEFSEADLHNLLYYHQDLLAELKANHYRPLRYYDYEDNYLRLRHKRGDMPGDEHNLLVDYLMQILLWLFHGKDVRIQRDLNIYETSDFKEFPLYPDLFVIPGQRDLGTSYQVERDGPPPILIIEVISKKTRIKDIGPGPQHKPQRYEKWGVAEYFSYDPRSIRPAREEPQRLWGWRLVEDQYQVIPTEGDDGRMWSEQLDSWLVPDGPKLRLYDQAGNLRIDRATYEEFQKNQEKQKTLKEKRRADQEKQRADRLAERLRQLGIDPDQLD